MGQKQYKLLHFVAIQRTKWQNIALILYIIVSN